MTAPAGQPQLLVQNQGQAIWFLNSLTILKATRESTGGAFALAEQFMAPGFITPYHRHRLEDEIFYVIDGHLTFVIGGRKMSAGPGTYVYGPREIPHGFRVDGGEEARILVWTTPAGFERFLVELGEPAQELRIPEPVRHDEHHIAAVAAKYQIEILGPLPD